MSNNQNDDQRRRPRGGPRNDVDWAAIRAAYEAGEGGFSILGRRFDVQRQSVAHRARTEHWAVSANVSEHIAEQARSNVIDMATRRAVEKMGGPKAVEARAEAIAEGLQRHIEIERLLLDVAKVSLDDAKSGNFKMVAGSDRVTVAEARERSVNTAAKAIDKSREIHGLTAGRPSIARAGEDNVPADSVVLVVRERDKMECVN